jgi:adhesin/invasin
VPGSIWFPNGTGSVTVTVTDTTVEVVTVSLTETSGTGLAEVAGTVTFIAGPATQVVVVSASEPLPGTVNSVVVTIEVRDADGNVQPSHPAYTANVLVTGAANVVPVSISIPSGTGSVTVTVTDTAAEVVTVTLTETSATLLTEVAGTVTFIQGPAVKVVVSSGTEAAPGSSNQVILTVEVQDADNNPQPSHPAYTANVVVSGFGVPSPLSISIPNGTASVTVTITDTKVEVVTVDLSETSSTGLAEVGGTATFIAGPATQVVVVSTSEPAPGTANSVVVTIEVRDADGNLQPSHALYGATVGVTGSAVVVGSPISIPNGTSSVTITVNDTGVEVVTVSLSETTGTGLAEVSGTVAFIAGKPVKVQVLSASGPAGSLVLTVEVRDANDNPQPNHAPYTATAVENSPTATVTAGNPVTIPGGTASVTITVTDLKAEAVPITLLESTFSGLSSVGGTATFTTTAATKVVVKNAIEAAPGTIDSVIVTIEVQDANGNAQPTHPAYTATVSVTGSASIVGSPISIPSGTASTTITVNDALAETVTVSLTETSGTPLTEQSGTVAFNPAIGVPRRVVAISVTEAAPGTGNSVTMTFQAQDDLGNAIVLPSPYTANLFVTGQATIGGADNITINFGQSQVTKTIDDTVAEAVTVTMVETSFTNMAEVPGTATFIAGTATRVRVLPAMEVGTSGGASVPVTIRVEDANGNPVSSHPNYTANVSINNGDSVAPTSISIPNGTVSVVVTATEPANNTHTSTVTLTETSSSGLAEVSGTVSFVNLGSGQATQVVVLNATEAAPGSANQVNVTIQVQDGVGNPITSHPAYTAIVLVNGSATVNGGITITIPDGTSSVTKQIDDAAAEVVTVTLVETSGTIYTEVAGTATFIPGPANRIRVVDTVEPYPSSSNSVTVTVRCEDNFGNPQSSHPNYTATLTASGSGAIIGSPISIPNGVVSTTITVTNNGTNENVNVNLTETSVPNSGLAEDNGVIRFDSPQGASRAVVLSATEAAPGTSNSITMTVQLQLADGTPTTVHALYTATVTLTGSATTASTVTIPNGSSSTTITINDTKAEVVTVGLQETTTTGMTVITGTATFIVGTATQVAVVSAAEPAPYTADSVVVTIQVRDANGNAQPTHGAYTANVTVGGSATVVPGSISIPSGTSQVTVTVNDTAGEVVTVTLTETSGTGLTEVNGTVTFQLDPPEAVITASSNVAAAGGSIDFDGSASFAEFPYEIVTWAWDFNGDGVIDSTLADPAPWSYAQPGIYTVTLKVVDSGGFSDTSWMKVYVGGTGEPAGSITLTPADWTLPADGASSTTITSGVITDALGNVVADGTKITVFADRGTISGFVDAGSEAGLQATTVGGVITFQLKAGTQPGLATVRAKATAAEGAVVVTFTGVGKRPFVTGFSPTGQQTANPTAVTVTFSEDINPGTLTGFSLTLSGSLTGPVAGSVSYQPSTRTATFAVEGPIDVTGEVYTVVVSHDVQDPDGLGLDGNFNGQDDGASDDFVFVFGALADGVAPSVTSLTVAPDPFSPDQDGVEDTTQITIAATDVARWQATIVSGGVVVRTIVVTSGLTTTWDGRDESGAVVEEGTYDITVTAWDAAGNASSPSSGTVEVTSPLSFGNFGP